MNKPIIGITSNLLYRNVNDVDGKVTTCNNQEYDLAITKAGGIPILLPVTTDLDTIKAQVALCQGFLFAGGDDLNPLLYGEEPHKALGQVHSVTDRHQLTLIKQVLESRKPLLGICRGMQVLNVACGGNLYQDLSEYPRDRIKHSQLAPRHECTHTITVEPDSLIDTLLGDTFATNSFHHQAVHRLGTNIIATAWSKDRMIEGIELASYPFALGVQWHPEIMLMHSDAMLPLFTHFINSCQYDS